ncbi:MAG: hypothetical protein Q8M03_15470 [Legionella sp.]|nr:hypothetical protein [Legionella sp.]
MSRSKLNQSGNITGNSQDVNEDLKQIKNPANRTALIKSFVNQPDSLKNFNDEQLALILSELTSPKNLMTVLIKCSEQLKERPQAISLLMQNRINDMTITNVLVSEYLDKIPAAEWVKNWKVIVSHLASKQNVSDIFTTFDKEASEEILNSYENLINMLNPMITKKESYQSWVNTLLLPQGVWKIFRDMDDDIDARIDDSVLGIQSTGAGMLRLVALPVFALISLLGIIPALVAGAIYLAKVKPTQSEIETHLKDYPGITAENLIKGYERYKIIHESLQNKTTPGLFQPKKPDEDELASEEYQPGKKN